MKTLESQLSFIEQEIKERLDKDDELKAKAKKTSKRLEGTSVGRPLVKRMLFMCAMVAVRNDKDLKVFYVKNSQGAGNLK